MATNTVIPAVDVGTGTGAGDEGTGAGTEVVEEEPAPGGEPGGEGAPGGDEGAGEGGEDAGEGDQQPGDEELSDEELGLERDGRKVDAATRTAISKLKKVDPAAAKRVADTYFSNQRLLQEAGAKNTSEAVKLIRAQKATIEALGGEDGITELQSKVEDYDREIEQFANGDPGLVKQLIDANPEAMVTNAQTALQLLSERDPVLFDEALLPAFVARLKTANFKPTIDHLLGLVREGKGQEAFDVLTGMSGWWDTLEANNKKRMETKQQTDPRMEELNRREQDLTQKEQQQYTRDIERDLNRLNNSATTKVVEGFFKDMRIQLGGKRRFIGALNSEVYTMMKDDKSFQRQIKAIRARGNAHETAEFAAQKFAEYLPTVFKRLRNEMYPGYKGGAKKVASATTNGAAQKATATNSVRVNAVAGKRPDRDDIDWTKTSEPMFMTGKAMLKNGKMHTWSWKDV